MCDGLGQPSSATEALGMLDRALDHLNAADAASLPAGAQADVLRALERAGAKHTAARSRVLAAFAGQAAYEDDGQGSAGTWLKWQCDTRSHVMSGTRRGRSVGVDDVGPGPVRKDRPRPSVRCG